MSRIARNFMTLLSLTAVPLAVIGALLLTVQFTRSPAGAPPAGSVRSGQIAASLKPTSPIKHVIIIVREDHSSTIFLAECWPLTEPQLLASTRKRSP